MAELTIKQKKEWAKLLYLRENLTQKEIAERTGVSTVTINKWINHERWEDEKTSITITKEEQLKNLYRQLAELNKEIAGRDDGHKYASTKEADTITKLASAIEKMETDIGLSDIISTFRAFLSWHRQFDLAEAQRLAPVFDSFIKSRIK